MLVIVFYFFSKKCNFCQNTDVLVFLFFPKHCYLRQYTVVGCMYAATFGCMYAVVGCMYAETFGCMYAAFVCISDTADSLPDSRYLA